MPRPRRRDRTDESSRSDVTRKAPSGAGLDAGVDDAVEPGMRWLSGRPPLVQSRSGAGDVDPVRLGRAVADRGGERPATGAPGADGAIPGPVRHRVNAGL